MTVRFVTVDDKFELPDSVKATLDNHNAVRWEPRSVYQPRTRIHTLCSSGFDQTVSTNMSSRSNTGFRVPVKVTEATSRWRVKMRNYGTGGTAKTALTGKGIKVGPIAGEGRFVDGVASTVVAGDFAIPGDGTFYYSPWVTDPALQLKAGVEYAIASGWTAAANLVVQTLLMKAWHFSTANAALNAADNTGQTVGLTGVPVDFQVEYETTSTRLSGVWLGDSVSEGVTGPPGTAQDGNVLQPWSESYPNMWARTNNAVVNNMAGSGFSASTFATFNDPFTRIDHAAAAYDFGVVALGTNDYTAADLATFQTNMTTVVGKMRSQFGLAGKPIYLLAATARSQFSSRDAIRQSMNTWMASLPLGAAGFVDMASALAGSPTAAALPAANTSDNVHPSYEGRDRLAAKMGASVKLLRPAAPVRNNDLFGTYTQAQYDALAGGLDPNKLYLIRG